jgi:hypothetical protein
MRATTKDAEQARGPDAEDLCAESLCRRGGSVNLQYAPQHAKRMPDMTVGANAMIEQYAARNVESRGQTGQKQRTKATKDKNKCNAKGLRWPGPIRCHKIAAQPGVAGVVLAESVHSIALRPRCFASFVPKGNGIQTARSPA